MSLNKETKSILLFCIVFVDKISKLIGAANYSHTVDGVWNTRAAFTEKKEDITPKSFLDMTLNFTWSSGDL